MTFRPRVRRSNRKHLKKRLAVLAHVLSILWLLQFTAKAEVYWSYVPHPPVLHPVTWVDEQVPIYVNNTHVGTTIF